jgi:hypothetical protein
MHLWRRETGRAANGLDLSYGVHVEISDAQVCYNNVAHSQCLLNYVRQVYSVYMVHNILFLFSLVIIKAQTAETNEASESF